MLALYEVILAVVVACLIFSIHNYLIANRNYFLYYLMKIFVDVVLVVVLVTVFLLMFEIMMVKWVNSLVHRPGFVHGLLHQLELTDLGVQGVTPSRAIELGRRIESTPWLRRSVTHSVIK